MTERPALCIDCGEAPARRLLDDRWVCEGCYADAARAADTPRPSPAPAAAAPAPTHWEIEVTRRLLDKPIRWRCIRTDQSRRRLEQCGTRHRSESAALEHATELNLRQGRRCA